MRKNLFIKQRDSMDCGACSLLSIIRYYEGNIGIEQIRLDTKTNKNGTTAFNIINAGRKYGLDGIGKRIDKLEEIEDLPVIAHVVTEKGYEHFVVIYKINKKYVLIMDPASGFKKIRINNFLLEWDNIILILRPYKSIINIPNNNNLLDFIISTCKREKVIFIKLLVDSIIIALLSLISTFYWRFVFSSSFTFNNKVLFISILFLFFTILKILIVRKKNYWQTVFNKRIDTRFILDFLNHIFNLPLDIIRNRTSGEILTRVKDINNIKELFSNILITLFLEFFLAICSILILFVLNIKLAIIVIIILILYLIITILTSSSIYRKSNDIIELETEFNASLSENVERLNTINNLNITNYIFNKIRKIFYGYQNGSFDYQLFLNNYYTIRNSIYEFGLFIINTYGFYLILNNKFTIIRLITFDAVLNYVLGPVLEIIDNIPKISFIKLNIAKINDFLSIKVVGKGKVEDFINGDIVFDKISYSYNDYQMVLKDVNIKINCGDRLLIRGKSGIGKSTLLQLLNRNIENYKGNILINNINIRDYNLVTIKKNVRYISQREFLFTGSIKENIVFDKEYSIEYINKILKLTKLDELIDKKELRLNSLIIDGGSNISGGEKQRIILARAIIDKPPILILDEALSEMDAYLEKEILKNISNFLNDTTIIYISHHREIEGFKLLKMDNVL